MKDQSKWVCGSCNTRNNMKHNFCIRCGAERPDQKKCEKCGATLTADQRFCFSCGTPVERNIAFDSPVQMSQSSRYCIKCGKPVVGEVFLCEQCKAKKKRTTSLWMRSVAAVLVVALLSGIAVHFVGNRTLNVKNAEQTSPVLKDLGDEVFYEANSKCIEFETRNIAMNSDSEGSVTLTVQLPDYTQLYNDAYTSKNPDQFLLKALQSGEYDVCEYEIVANVTIENGKQVIYSDEAIDTLLKRELAKATNALLEAQK